jgi:hypothetical protein
MSADLGYVVENVDSLQHQPVVHLPPCYAKKLAIKKKHCFHDSNFGTKTLEFIQITRKIVREGKLQREQQDWKKCVGY